MEGSQEEEEISATPPLKDFVATLPRRKKNATQISLLTFEGIVISYLVPHQGEPEEHVVVTQEPATAEKDAVDTQEPAAVERGEVVTQEPALVLGGEVAP